MKFSINRMSSVNQFRQGAPVRSLVLAGLVAGCLACAVNPAAAQTALGTDQVEEDWVLVIGTPSSPIVAPQIINVIAPVAHVNAEYGLFCLNHSTEPNYVGGGLQMQRWNGEFLTDYRPPLIAYPLANAGERITYTMRMKIDKGRLAFGVVNGRSQSWGNFGGETTQWNSDMVSPYVDLRGYSPYTSAQYTEVGFGANMVSSFTLKSVRYYKNGKLQKSEDPGLKVRVY